jgi:hypothetical protein
LDKRIFTRSLLGWNSNCIDHSLIRAQGEMEAVVPMACLEIPTRNFGNSQPQRAEY